MKPLSLNPLYLTEYQTNMKVLPTIFVYYTINDGTESVQKYFVVISN